MTAPGFCTCKRDFPHRIHTHPAAGATWHYLCERPVVHRAEDCTGCPLHSTSRITPTGTGWPEDGEAQRIAEVFADARAEQDRGL